jgi:large subunit ribosomal protein L21
MFAVVRTGGKQYRVAAGDKIVVEKLAGEAGDSVSLGDILLAGNGSDLQDVAGVTVAAEIIAQAKGDKVIVFKKRRRHNYRRKQGHRQQYTILRIVSVGGKSEQKADAGAAKAAAADKPAAAAKSAAAAPAEASETSTPKATAAKAKPTKITKAK